MKSILLIYFIVFSSCCWGQEKKISIDKLTGDTSYFLNLIYLNQGMPKTIPAKRTLYFNINESKGNVSLFVNGDWDYELNTKLTPQDSIFFKLLSGKVLAFPYKGTTETSFVPAAYMTLYQAEIDIDNHKLYELIKEPIVFVRVSTQSSKFDYDVPKRNQLNLKQAIMQFNPN